MSLGTNTVPWQNMRWWVSWDGRIPSSGVTESTWHTANVEQRPERCLKHINIYLWMFWSNCCWREESCEGQVIFTPHQVNNTAWLPRCTTTTAPGLLKKTPLCFVIYIKLQRSLHVHQPPPHHPRTPRSCCSNPDWSYSLAILKPGWLSCRVLTAVPMALHRHKFVPSVGEARSAFREGLISRFFAPVEMDKVGRRIIKWVRA